MFFDNRTSGLIASTGDLWAFNQYLNSFSRLNIFKSLCCILKRHGFRDELLHIQLARGYQVEGEGVVATLVAERATNRYFLAT